MAVKNFKNLLLVAGLGVCLQASSFAADDNSVATIAEANGTVMVDRGAGFEPRNINQPLFENDRVVTLDNSEAEIVFHDGCRTKLKAKNLIVINANPGCKAAILDTTKGVPTAVASNGPSLASIVGPIAVLGVVAGVTKADPPISGQ